MLDYAETAIFRGGTAGHRRLAAGPCASSDGACRVSVGALAIGALAIGRLAIKRVVIDGATLKRLRIGELEVDRVRVNEPIVVARQD